MTDEKLDALRLDEMLKMFTIVKTKGKIPKSILLDHPEAPDDWHRAVRFLADEGYLKEFPDYFEITYKGETLVHAGGFVAKQRHERIARNCAVIGTAVGILGLLIALIALVLQVFDD